MLKEDEIYNEDCLNLLRKLPPKSIDLILTDPPYGIGYDQMAAKASGTKSVNAAACKTEYRHTNWDTKIPSKEIFDEIFRVSKNQIIFGGNYFTEYLKPTPSWIVWNKKGDGRFSNKFADGELAWTSFDNPLKIYNFLWNGMIQQDMKNKEKRIHPTQKPVDLFGQILRDYSSENDLVLDCFSGSGTTAIACHNLNRRFICIERDSGYYDASIIRLDEHKRQSNLFINSMDINKAEADQLSIFGNDNGSEEDAA